MGSPADRGHCCVSGQTRRASSFPSAELAALPGSVYVYGGVQQNARCGEVI